VSEWSVYCLKSASTNPLHFPHPVPESRLHNRSNQNSALSPSKGRWPTVTCLSGVLPDVLFRQRVTRLAVILQCTLTARKFVFPRLGFNQRGDNGATFIRPCWGLLRHTQSRPEIIIKLRRKNSNWVFI
jgi:hypothetical protein